MCTLKYAAPVLFCENCQSEYGGLNRAYGELLIANDSVTHEICKNMYFNVDKLNVIATIHQQTIGIWETAFCPDCTTDKIHEIIPLIEAFDYCFNNTQDPCKNCSTSHSQVHDMFKKFMTNQNGTVCFDIQDRMNRSEMPWTARCGKTERKSSLAAFAGLSSCLLFIQALFYGGFVFFKKHIRQDRDHLENESDSESSNAGQRDEQEPPTIEESSPKPQIMKKVEGDELSLSDSSKDVPHLVEGSLKFSRENGDNFTEMHPYLKQEKIGNVDIADLSESSDDDPPIY